MLVVNRITRRASLDRVRRWSRKDIHGSGCREPIVLAPNTIHILKISSLPPTQEGNNGRADGRHATSRKALWLEPMDLRAFVVSTSRFSSKRIAGIGYYEIVALASGSWFVSSDVLTKKRRQRVCRFRFRLPLPLRGKTSRLAIPLLPRNPRGQSIGMKDVLPKPMAGAKSIELSRHRLCCAVTSRS